MANLSALVRLSDGRLIQMDLDDEFLPNLKLLQKKGYSGRQIIDHLISSDWETPPHVVELFGLTPNGKEVYVCLRY